MPVLGCGLEVDYCKLLPPRFCRLLPDELVVLQHLDRRVKEGVGGGRGVRGEDGLG